MGKKNWSKSILSKKIGFEKYWAHKMFGPKKFGSEIIGSKKRSDVLGQMQLQVKLQFSLLLQNHEKRVKKTIAANFIKLNNNINKLLQI